VGAALKRRSASPTSTADEYCTAARRSIVRWRAEARGTGRRGPHHEQRRQRRGPSRARPMVQSQVCDRQVHTSVVGDGLGRQGTRAQIQACDHRQWSR